MISLYCASVPNPSSPGGPCSPCSPSGPCSPCGPRKFPCGLQAPFSFLKISPELVFKNTSPGCPSDVVGSVSPNKNLILEPLPPPSPETGSGLLSDIGKPFGWYSTSAI